jgi:uncharacterized protein YjiK
MTSIASHPPHIDIAKIDLNDYQITHHQTVEMINHNLSGITYSNDSDSLFAVINNPEQVVELDKKGQLLRRIKLINFIDTEGITYLGQQQFAITQERQRSVTIVDITQDTQSLNADDYKQFSLKSSNGDNLGLEGIAWAPNLGLFVANEKSPAEVIHIPPAPV